MVGWYGISSKLDAGAYYSMFTCISSRFVPAAWSQFVNYNFKFSGFLYSFSDSANSLDYTIRRYIDKYYGWVRFIYIFISLTTNE